jgi:hypothetical protein
MRVHVWGPSAIKADGIASKRGPHSGSKKSNTVPPGLPPHSTLDSDHPPLLRCVSVSRRIPAAESAKARQQSAQKGTNKEHMLLLKPKHLYLTSDYGRRGRRNRITVSPLFTQKGWRRELMHLLLKQESLLIMDLLLLPLHRGPLRAQKAWHNRRQELSAPQPGPRMCLL